jgi:phospholipid/cholesterol/gamma-HCH transport system permease protein
MGSIAYLLRHVGAYTTMLFQMLKYSLRPPMEFGLIVDQIDHIGVKSLSIVNVTILFTGMVLSLQTAYALATFGAKPYIAEIVSLSLVRELGPVLTALMVGGRVGSGITAEIGSMNVTSQVDAIRALGASPIKKLVIPKVVATVITLPLLTILADVIGILGGLIIAVYQIRLTPYFYYEHVMKSVVLGDVFSGLGKSVFFAFVISTVGCYNGLVTEGGAEGVGKAATRTVVVASITILISDFFLTKLFLYF